MRPADLAQIDARFNNPLLNEARGNGTPMKLPAFLVRWGQMGTTLVIAIIAIPLQVVVDLGSFAAFLKRPCDAWERRDRG